MDAPSYLSVFSSRSFTGMNPEARRRVTLASSLALLWTIFTLVAQFSGALDKLEQPIVDWLQTLASSPVPSNDQLALVAIDDIPQDRPWPWPRLDYSLMLRAMVDYIPDSVVFEMDLYDSDPKYNSFDDTFAGVVGRANTVIFDATARLSLAAPEPLPANAVTIPFQGDTTFIPRFPTANWPLATFAGKSPMGIGNIEPSSGLVCHSLPMVFIINHSMVPSLVLISAAELIGADLSQSEVQIGRAIYLRKSNGQLLRTIPIDSAGRLQIRYHTTPPASWAGSFDNIVVYADEMQRGVSSERDLRMLRNRQVWVGRTDPDAPNHFVTPLGKLSSLEVQMQAERTILDQDYIRPLPPIFIGVLYFAMAIGGAVISVRLGPMHSAGLVFFALAFYFETAVLMFRIDNIVLPIISFIVLLVGCYAVGFLALAWELEPLPTRINPRRSSLTSNGEPIEEEPLDDESEQLPEQ